MSDTFYVGRVFSFSDDDVPLRAPRNDRGREKSLSKAANGVKSDGVMVPDNPP